MCSSFYFFTGRWVSTKNPGNNNQTVNHVKQSFCSETKEIKEWTGKDKQKSYEESSLKLSIMETFGIDLPP